MKKHYNITHLTDELSNSVFFQKPEQTEEPEAKHQRTLAPTHQVTKAENHQRAIEPSNQHAQDTKHESTKEPSKQSAKEPKHCSTQAL